MLKTLNCQLTQKLQYSFHWLVFEQTIRNLPFVVRNLSKLFWIKEYLNWKVAYEKRDSLLLFVLGSFIWWCQTGLNVTIGDKKTIFVISLQDMQSIWTFGFSIFNVCFKQLYCWTSNPNRESNTQSSRMGGICDQVHWKKKKIELDILNTDCWIDCIQLKSNFRAYKSAKTTNRIQQAFNSLK